jgi:2-amino-4-hydroxy-6-hydroxymethyldihydropteridine diphosphokinase
MSNLAYISLGGNVGNTQEIFQEALKEVEKRIGNILQQSSLYQTAAWGNTEQNDFLNQVIWIESALEANQLLDSLLTIELLFGRERKEPWGPRTLDLDLLFFNQEIIQSDHLMVPHPRIKERKFILVPLNEIAVDFIDPQTGKTIEAILHDCADDLVVKKIH